VTPLYFFFFQPRSKMSAIIGKGTILSNSADGTTYAVVARVTDIKIPKEKLDKIEVTEYADTIKQHLPGWLDAGEVPVKLNYDKTSRAALKALVGITKYWKITYPDTSTDVFQAWMSELGGDVPIKDRITSECVLVLVTDSTFTAGS